MYLLVFQTETDGKFRVYALYDNYCNAIIELRRLRALPGSDKDDQSFLLFSLNTTELEDDSPT